MEYKLEKYQDDGVNNISKSLSVNQRVIAVSPGGSGKTVIISNICKRVLDKSPNTQIVIFVHKKELLDSARKTIFLWYGLKSQEISSDTKNLENVNIFVCMVETFDRRATNVNRFLSHFNNVGLVIIDEVHLGNFKKILVHFPLAKTIGFTATPISANKKEPINKFYQDIIVVTKPSELIKLNEEKRDRGIVPSVTFGLKNIERSSLKMKGDDFDEDYMGKEFSKTKQVSNTVNAYITHSYGKKMFCYNSNIEHSLIVTKAFQDAGLNARHVDGKKSGQYGNPKYREDVFKWFNNTPNAILCNVGIATIGTDVPSADGCIINRSTTSLTLWIQMCVRSSRPYRYPNGEYKDHSIILDLGDNAAGGGLLEPTFDHDWENYFNNPKSLKKTGVGVVKDCPNCGAITYSSARICLAKKYNWLDDSYEECGHIFSINEQKEDLIERTLVKITTNIDVKANIDFFKDRKEYYSFYQTLNQLANLVRSEVESDYLDAHYLNTIFEVSIFKASEWFKLMGKRRYPNFKEDIKNKMIESLKKLGFIIPVEEILELSE